MSDSFICLEVSNNNNNDLPTQVYAFEINYVHWHGSAGTMSKKALRVSSDNAQCFFTLMEEARAYKAECNVWQKYRYLNNYFYTCS